MVLRGANIPHLIHLLISQVQIYHPITIQGSSSSSRITSHKILLKTVAYLKIHRIEQPELTRRPMMTYPKVSISTPPPTSSTSIKTIKRVLTASTIKETHPMIGRCSHMATKSTQDFKSKNRMIPSVTSNNLSTHQLNENFIKINMTSRSISNTIRIMAKITCTMVAQTRWTPSTIKATTKHRAMLASTMRCRGTVFSSPAPPVTSTLLPR